MGVVYRGLVSYVNQSVTAVRFVTIIGKEQIKRKELKEERANKEERIKGRKNEEEEERTKEEEGGRVEGREEEELGKPGKL